MRHVLQQVSDAYLLTWRRDRSLGIIAEIFPALKSWLSSGTAIDLHPSHTTNVSARLHDINDPVPRTLYVCTVVGLKLIGRYALALL